MRHRFKAGDRIRLHGGRVAHYIHRVEKQRGGVAVYLICYLQHWDNVVHLAEPHIPTCARCAQAPGADR